MNIDEKKILEKNPIIDSDKSIPFESKDERNICKIHAKKPLIFYCEPCKKLACQFCFVEFHKKHDYQLVEHITEEIAVKSKNAIDELKEKLENANIEANLEETQKNGLKYIYESKAKLLSYIDDFYSKIIEKYKALTSDIAVSKEKHTLFEKANKILEKLEIFEKETLNGSLIEEFFQKDYLQEKTFISKTLDNFIVSTKKNYIQPKIIVNEHQLEIFSDILLNYISVITTNSELLNSKKLEENINISKICQPDYFESDNKLLHYLLANDKRLILYNIENNSTAIIPITCKFEIPNFMCSIMTPNNSIYFFSGITTEMKISKQTFLFDMDKGLITLAQMPIPKLAPGYCYNNGILYCFGGKIDMNYRTNICERYIIKENKWLPIPEMNKPRSSPGVAVYKQEDIYVFFGGEDGDSLNKTIERYSINQSKWSFVNVKNTVNGFEINNMSAVQINYGQILIFGGIKKNKINSFNVNSRVLLFHVKDETIENYPDILPNISSELCKPVILNNCIYSLRNLRESLYPDFSEFDRIFSILEISSNENEFNSKYIDIVNCFHLMKMANKKKEQMD